MDIAQISKTCWNADVYEPSDDSFLLVDALLERAPSWSSSHPACVLEIGCGSGYVICSVALMLQQLQLQAYILATDLSLFAAAAAQTTLHNHAVSGVEVVLTDLVGGLGRLAQQVDLLIFNPPYVPTPAEEVTRGGIARAWAGGHRGRVVIDRVLEQLDNILAPGGELFMVTVSENDPQGIILEVQARGYQGCVAATRQADEETLTILRIEKPKHSKMGT